MTREAYEKHGKVRIYFINYYILACAILLVNSAASVSRYSMSQAPPSCENVENLVYTANLTNRKQAKWLPNNSLGMPQLLMEEVVGYQKVNGTASMLFYMALGYTLLDNATTKEGYRCFYQSSWLSRKLESLNEWKLPVHIANHFFNQLETDKSPNGTIGDVFSLFFSSGMLEFFFDLVKNPWPRVILESDVNCKTCIIKSCHVHYKVDYYYFLFFINTSRRIRLKFSPAYIGMSKLFLSYLNDESDLEEFFLHGGDSWTDPGILFPPLKKLRVLDLSNNGISYLTKENFHAASNVEELSLAKNNLKEIPRGIFLLKQLSKLDLSHNPLYFKSLSVILERLPNLKILNISNTFLKEFADLEPAGKNSDSLLELLDIGWCKLETLNSEAASRFFSKNHDIKILHLAGNPLHTIPSGIFSPLRNLKFLDLSHARFWKGQSLRFFPGTCLTLLMGQNNISNPEDILSPDGSTFLKTLDLSGNPLRPWTKEDVFSFVLVLNLSYTGLTFLTEEMLNSLKKLNAVDFGGDPIDCRSCYTGALKHWLGLEPLPQILSLGQKSSLYCEYPLEYKGVAVSRVTLPTNCGDDTGSNQLVTGVVGAVAGAIVLLFLTLTYYFRLELRYLYHLVHVSRTIAIKGIPQASDFDAFVCYSKKDRSWVIGELLPRLESGNPRYKLCLHERDFRLGSLIVQNIVECMHRSRHTLIVLTPAFVNSQWCQWELEMATHRLLEGAHDFLILIELERLDSRTLPGLLRLLMATRTCLEWPPINGVGDKQAIDFTFERLRNALGPPIDCSTVVNQVFTSHTTTVNPSLDELS